MSSLMNVNTFFKAVSPVGRIDRLQPKFGRRFDNGLYEADDYVRLPELIKWETIASGVQYSQILLARPKRSYYGRTTHVLKIDPGLKDKKISLILTGNPFAELNYKNLFKLNEMRLETPWIAALNGSFYRSVPYEYKYVPVGMLMQDGNWISGSSRPRATLGITDKGEYKINRVKMESMLHLEKDGVPKSRIILNSLNQLPLERCRYIRHCRDNYFEKRGIWDEVILFDSRWGKEAPPIEPNMREVKIENGCVVEISDDHPLKIPDQEGYVIAGPKERLIGIQIGESASCQLGFSGRDWDEVKFAISGRPLIVKNGRIVHDLETENHPPYSDLLDKETRRTAIGVTVDNELLWVTTPDINLWDLAHLMKNLGAKEAFNLDGGPSTEMHIPGKLETYSSRDLPVALGIFNVVA